MFIYVRHLMNMVAKTLLYTKGVRSQRMFDAEGELKSPQRLKEQT